MLAGEDDDDEVTLAGITPAGGEEPQDPQMKLSRAIQTLNVEGVLELLTSNTVDVNKRDARGYVPYYFDSFSNTSSYVCLFFAFLLQTCCHTGLIQETLQG